MDVQPVPTALNLQAIAILVAVIVAAIGWIVVIVGWFFNAKISRNLQRKQLAIQVMMRLSENQHYNRVLTSIYKKIRDYPAYKWETLAVKRYKSKKFANKKEEQFCDDLVDLLNYYEVLSIAVLNRAIDEDVIKWSHEGLLAGLYTHTSKYIDETRKLTHDNQCWCNFMKLSTEWIDDAEKGKGAKPS